MAKSYSEKLKSPKWQEKRLKIFQRDKFTCTICGDTETSLQVHHKKYIPGNEPWEAPDHDLTTLCEDCHYYLTQHLKITEGSDVFDLQKIYADGNKFLHVMSEGTLTIILPAETNRLTVTPATLKKLVHFVINNWLKHG